MYGNVGRNGNYGDLKVRNCQHQEFGSSASPSTKLEIAFAMPGMWNINGFPKSFLE